MNFIDEEIPKYTKKSQAKPPKKAKHKHVFEPCIIEIPEDWHKKEHEQSGKKRPIFEGFCPICGKIGPIDQSRWWEEKLGHIGMWQLYGGIPTEEGARELNPATRTLPTFHGDDPFVKFVNLK